MYARIWDIEVFLHTNIRRVLEAQIGTDGWWSQIPEDDRLACAERKEKDKDPVDGPYAYAYTCLIDLKTIIEKKWDHFKGILPPELSQNKKQLLSELNRLNSIRNDVMHPVRGKVPAKEDFDFVSNLATRLKMEAWKLPSS